ncbi:hypothetical protein BYT27DRAFT_7173908 [Phlegmacium glaucopus]|nr:hypothetical protein BYT27DRAFT_7173908 [Phlegmacium glaucopus]
MPKTPRKSSLGISRRGPLKAHIPYRGDNPEVGKKTGIAVQHVERQSDGFELFEQVIQQADGRTPPRPKRRKKSLSVAAHQDEDDYGDDGGEESMQLDSPVQYLVDARPPVSPARSLRTQSSVRPVARTSDIDFDKIPSPRPNTSLQRNARNSVVPGPSRASRIYEPEPDTGSPDPGDQNDMGPDPFDNYSPQESRSPHQVSPRKSFARIEEDQDEDEGEGEDGQEEEADAMQDTPSKSKQDKGKRKTALHEEPDQDVEDEIAQELEDVGSDRDSEDDMEVEQEPQPSVKKVKGEVKNPHKAPTESKTKKENRSPRQGIRKSQREHYRPLEYWRGEKLVYGRTHHSGPILVPQIKEIIRIPKEATVTLGTKRKRGPTRRSKALEAAEDVIPPALPVVNPEEGWDDKTKAKCTVIHFTTKEEVERRIVWTAKMVEPRQALNHNWSFDKIFGDDDFMAAGQLIIPPDSIKPSKAAKDNTYVFYVIEGAVNFKIYNTSSVVTTGGMFMVPRGNTYLIENVSNRDAKLFFAQARKVNMNMDELVARAEAAADLQRRKSVVRSSSVGVPSTRTNLPTPNGRAASMASPIGK